MHSYLVDIHNLEVHHKIAVQLNGEAVLSSDHDRVKHKQAPTLLLSLLVVPPCGMWNQAPVSSQKSSIFKRVPVLCS